MKKRNNWMEKAYRFLVCILPAVLFFSYYPLMHFGSDAAMNYEISLPIIWLLMFDVLAFVMMVRKKKLFCNWQKKWPWVLLPVWLSLSVLWSMNSVRGLLTVGILWLIYFAGDAMFELRDVLKKNGFKELFWKMFFGSALFVCGWCLVQCVLDLAGVSRDYSLMCEGCTYTMFGFPRVNGFAAEPQFMGNLLLAPAIVAGYFYLKKQKSKNLKLKRSRGVFFTTAKSDSAPYCSTGSSSVAAVKTTSGSRFLCSKFLLLCFFVFTTTLFLTMSRGAIYAFVVAMVVMTIVMVVRSKKARALVVWPVVIVAFLFALNLQGIMAQVSKTDDTYVSGVSKVINQLSLGVIDLGKTNSEVEPIESDVGSEASEKAHFDGYVEVSTDMRVGLSEAAIQIWSQDFKTIVAGVGLGGATNALSENDKAPTTKEIVNNEYVSLLLETGVVGIALLILTLVLVGRVVMKSQNRAMITTLILAYGVSLLFFSGLPNALHIYLLPAMILVAENLPKSLKNTC